MWPQNSTVTNSFYGFYLIGNDQISEGQPGNSPSKSVTHQAQNPSALVLEEMADDIHTHYTPRMS